MVSPIPTDLQILVSVCLNGMWPRGRFANHVVDDGGRAG